MLLEDEADQHVIEAGERNRIKGTEKVLTTMDPPQAGGVRVVLGTSKGNPRLANLVDGRATRRVRARRRNRIQTEPN